MSQVVFFGNSYVNGKNGNHYEGFVETRAEIATESTRWAVGSFLFCGEDGSTWMLVTSNGTKLWQEMTA